MKLRIILKDSSYHILPLIEEEWEFSVRFGSRNDSDNLLLISNSLYNMSNGQNIIDFFQSVRNIPYEDILNVQLYTNDEVLLFDSASLGFYYNHMYIDYKYNSSMDAIGMAHKGLTYGFAFRSAAPEELMGV